MIFFELLWISFLMFSFWLKDRPYLCINIMLTDLGFEVSEKFHNPFCYFFSSNFVRLLEHINV